MVPLETYIKNLKSHDWFYNYSDDFRYYSKGIQERTAICKLQKELDPDYKIWNQYAPGNYKVKE